MTTSTPHERVTLIGLSADERRAAFARDIAAGLTASPKHLPCCYFYDRLGSCLFEAICQLPEYYLTRAEHEILQAHADEIAGLMPPATDLIELGSGSATKTRLLIDAFLRRQLGLRYVPVDICRTALQHASLDLARTYPSLKIMAIAAEYREGLAHLGATAAASKLILWLGSNIGNFGRAEAARFLGQVRETMTPGDRLLVGIDLRKDRATLEAAYDDPCGVTAAFNRNLLARINRECGGHLDLRAFQHRAAYDEEAGRIEMYLVSNRAQRVAIDGPQMEVSFAADEAIHTENSYKYSLAEIDALAAAAGLHCARRWLDAGRRFSVNLLVPSS